MAIILSDATLDKAIAILADPKQPSYHKEQVAILKGWLRKPHPDGLVVTEEQRRRIQDALKGGPPTGNGDVGFLP